MIVARSWSSRRCELVCGRVHNTVDMAAAVSYCATSPSPSRPDDALMSLLTSSYQAAGKKLSEASARAGEGVRWSYSMCTANGYEDVCDECLSAIRSMRLTTMAVIAVALLPSRFQSRVSKHVGVHQA